MKKVLRTNHSALKTISAQTKLLQHSSSSESQHIQDGRRNNQKSGGVSAKTTSNKLGCGCSSNGSTFTVNPAFRRDFRTLTRNQLGSHLSITHLSTHLPTYLQTHFYSTASPLESQEPTHDEPSSGCPRRRQHPSPATYATQLRNNRRYSQTNTTLQRIIGAAGANKCPFLHGDVTRSDVSETVTAERDWLTVAATQDAASAVSVQEALPMSAIPGPRALPRIGTMHKYIPGIGKH